MLSRMSSSKPGIDRPLTIVIAAMGGEGGGLLADWIVEGAKHSRILIQSTSIPGVAQRTGATAYYLEMMHAPRVMPSIPSLASIRPRDI
ncbi:MAG: hypothetical protein Ct9H300mP13_6510 [Gammaproteobacteria bacterium]|nr:MAG: hypothetical protein Ct9H300mP13_6510 [Gammaproteobacteria bacterium]